MSITDVSPFVQHFEAVLDIEQPTLHETTNLNSKNLHVTVLFSEI